MKLPDLPFKLPEMPRKAAIGFSILAGSLVLFVTLLFTLGGARDSAISENTTLTAQLAQTKTNLAQSQNDFTYVSDNQERYESLLQSDQLVPHTRLTAVKRMQEIAMQHGLTALNYDFNAAADTSISAVTAQPTGGSYRVNVESIKLGVGAPVDGKIYAFIHDVSKNFPGAAIIQTFSLARAPAITGEMLNAISNNQDAGLIKGDITFLWRTAQANEKKTEANAK